MVFQLGLVSKLRWLLVLLLSQQIPVRGRDILLELHLPIRDHCHLHTNVLLAR